MNLLSYTKVMLGKNFKLIATAIGLSTLVTACDSQSFTSEDTVIDSAIGRVTDYSGATQYVSMRKANATGYAFDGGSDGSEGKNVYLYNYNSSNTNQHWAEINLGNGHYQYQKRDTDFCLDGGNGGGNRNSITLGSCSSNENQHWKKIQTGSNYRLEKRNASSYSIDGNRRGSNGQDVYLWASSDTNKNQQWIFTNEGSIDDSSNPQNPINPTPPQECSSLDNLEIKRASSDFDYDDNYSPANAIDNNLSANSRWSTNGRDRSIILDLGDTSTVRSISTAWYKADVRTALFDVETSEDNRNWQLVLSQASVSNTQGMRTFDVLDTDARYVKIIGQGNSASSWTSLIEADVLGCGIIDDNAPTTPTTPTTPTENSIDLILSLFDLEGGTNDLNPVNGDLLVFDALNAKHVTPNGNGWRHEYKMAEENRRNMHDIDETFSATITPVLSSGSKTIVAQYHGGGLGTLVKLYVSDTNEGNLSDSDGDNGIFDLYARVKTSSSSSETVVKFGTIVSGESFDFTLKNNRGRVTLSTQGITETLNVADSDGAYLKFGNYLQAQDPISMEKYSDSDDWSDLYRSLGITQSVVTFSNIGYETNY